jgi:hypothetical protein
MLIKINDVTLWLIPSGLTLIFFELYSARIIAGYGVSTQNHELLNLGLD